MNEVIYLEPDEDITGVIARVKESDSPAVSLVIPRGGSIAQSVVNLKLIKREIEKLGKAISLVTKDKISKNLASQVGVTVYDSAQAAKNAKNSVGAMTQDLAQKPEGFSTNGIQINQYSRETVAEEEKEDEGEGEGGEDEEDQDVGDTATEAEIDREEEDNAKTEEQRVNLAHAKPLERAKIEKTDDKEEKMAKKNISSRRKPIIIISSILLVVLVLAGATFYPSANVRVTLATSDIEMSKEVMADKSVAALDLEKMAIPAKEYSQENSSEKTFATTGKKDVGSKASGEITFFNDYDPTNAIALANGTVLTAAGKSFILDGAITIPTANIISLYPLQTTPGQIKGKVVAHDNGDGFNIAPSKFTINSFSGVKQEKVYGQSSAALTGGVTKQINIASDDDLNNTKKSLGDELEATAKEALSKIAVEEQMKLVASSISKTEGDFTTSKNSGDEADNFSAKYTLKLTELAFSETLLRDSVTKKIEAGLKSNEMLVNPNSTDLAYDITGVDNVKGTISFSAKFIGKVGNKLDQVTIQNMLVRAKYGNAASKIEALGGVADAQISITPKAWPLLPFIKQRIHVSFDYQKE